MSKTASQLVREAKQHIENLSVKQVANEVTSGNILLVDLRESEERHQSGIIPGAIHAPRGILEFWADPTSSMHKPEFDPQQRTIVFCAGGGRSALAVQTLEQLGYGNVAHLEGGYTAWKEANQPTQSWQMWE